MVSHRNVGKVSVYPNPAFANLRVSFPQANISRTMQIIAADGRIVQVKTLIANSVQQHLEVTTLPKGNYFIKIERNTQTVSFTKQ